MAGILGGRVAIVGAGAVGLYYGARLADAGEDVSFLLRSDYDVVREQGIRLESVHGHAEVFPVSAFRSSKEIGPVDWVIVAWKATSNELLQEVLTPMLHSNTRVLTLQNGLGNCEQIGSFVDTRLILGGLCFVCLNRLSPGFVQHTAGGRIAVGEWGGEPGSETASLMVNALSAAGIPSEVAGNLEQAQWRKLVWNIPFNGLAIAEGGVTTDRLLADPDIEAEVAHLMREVIAVARGKGLEIEDSVVEFEISRTRPMGPYRPSSMIDFIEGRAVEYEAIWGEPLRQAREAGVSTPHLVTLASRIQERIASRR